MDESLLKRALAQVSCASCGRRYESEGIHVLGHEARLWFLRVVCAGCHTAGLVAALVRDQERAAGDAPVQPEAPPARPPQGPPVTVEDVQAVRQALDSFAGDISRLFSSN